MVTVSGFARTIQELPFSLVVNYDACIARNVYLKLVGRWVSSGAKAAALTLVSISERKRTIEELENTYSIRIEDIKAESQGS